MINIMPDIETMSTSHNAAMVAIGAVKFDIDFGITDEFYQTIDLGSSIRKGFDVDGDTIKWWMKQSQDARKEVYGKGSDIKDVLKEFREWVGLGNKQVWGNGSDFDNVIIGNAYKKFNAQIPWKYHENRCFRTLKSSFPSIDVPKVGTAHNALDDAMYQANYLIELVKKNKLTHVL